jgi:SAM-dependent methyltransferase
MGVRMKDPTKRFSDRVENYVKHRPGYPGEVIDTLRAASGLTPASVVADIGSGTGILTRLFLEKGNEVFAVEPNEAMRAAAEHALGAWPGFQSRGGTAEATGLPPQGVDFIVAGQAFHWFDQGAARVEFARILKPDGWVALVWNERQTASSPFLREYEAFLREHGTDYQEVNHMRIDESVLAAFYAPGPFQRYTFFNRQEFDLDGLRGRLLSSSYIPQEGTPGYGPMMAALDVLFSRHAREGKVGIDYDTHLYVGRFHV